MCNAVQKVLKVPWLYCMVHVINRAICMGLDCNVVNPLIEKAKKICHFSRSSPNATPILNEKQRALHLSIS